MKIKIRNKFQKNLLSLATSILASTLLATSATAATLPAKYLVGYVEGWQDNNSTVVQDAISNGYNVLVFSFASIDDNQISFGTITDSSIQNQINNTKAAGKTALISVGGQNNTFNPSANTDFSKLGETIATFLQDHNLDGVDLDLETIPAGVTSDQIALMVSSLRSKMPGVIITGAPQIGGGYGGPASLEPRSIWSQDFLNKVKFNALFIQEYNQFGGAKFDGKFDTDIGFITVSFGPLKDFIPAETKIVIGEPATSSAGSGLSNPNDIRADLTSGPVLQDERFGGLMTWDINYDSKNNWNWISNLNSLCN
jgi:chitinase